MAQLTPAQKAVVLTIIQSVGDLPTFVSAVQASYSSNSKASGITALAGVTLTVADWTAINNQIAAADTTAVMTLLADIATSISGTNKTTLQP